MKVVILLFLVAACVATTPLPQEEEDTSAKDTQLPEEDTSTKDTQLSEEDTSAEYTQLSGKSFGFNKVHKVANLFLKLKKKLVEGIEVNALKGLIEKTFGKESEMTVALEDVISRGGLQYKEILIAMLGQFLGNIGLGNI